MSGRKQSDKSFTRSKLIKIMIYIGIIGLFISNVILLIENINFGRESINISIGKFIQDTPIEITEGYGN